MYAYQTLSIYAYVIPIVVVHGAGRTQARVVPVQETLHMYVLSRVGPCDQIIG